ncbi:TetR/AcrR family transcriptional regulator [Herbaspirillum lusitanum]|uniref:TetR/AcrR family transcriptional regulator n=1 Tax=Herbaspirillum lusitanum TaxID=213312 RepID=A0ABW9ABA6_9BURK
MARPKSEDKRNAILTAAVTVMAEFGPAASTARIAKAAGVAEGSLFTYFATKDELMNQLYLEIKSDLREALLDEEVARAATPKQAIRLAWHRYVNWGVVNAEKCKVLAQLSVAECITDATRAEGSQAFGDLVGLLQHCIKNPALLAEPCGFAGAIMGALADATMDFMRRYPAQAEFYCENGFEAFWKALGK